MTTNWVKPLYYYLVMLISLFFVVIALFNIIRVYYINTFAPRLAETEIINSGLIPYNQNVCHERYESVTTDNKTEPKTIPADTEKCKQQVAEYKDLWVQQNSSWAWIAMILATLVMLVHYFTIGKTLGGKKTTPSTTAV